MTPRARIRELVMFPLMKCYPAAPPKKSQRSPAATARTVVINRGRTRRYLQERA